MILKMLEKLVNKERLIAQILSFVLGAMAAALGSNVEVVKDLLCQ